MSGISEVGVNRSIIGFKLRLNLEKGIIGGNAEYYSGIWFEEIGLAVV